MNKKVLIGVIIAIVVIAIVIGGYFIFSNKETASKNLDLATISGNITNSSGFAEMATQDVDKEVLSSYFQVDTANVEEVYGKIPMMNVQASMYVLIKATEGKAEDVKQNLETFGQSYEEQWSRYLPAQHELVQNRKIGTVGDYVYLIIAENADELVKLVK